MFREGRVRGLAGQHGSEDAAVRLNAWTGRTMRYTMIGAFCALLNNLAIIIGNFLGIHYLPMTIASFVIVTPLAYLLHAGFTFKEPGSLRGFLRFAAGLATAFPVFFLFMAILCTCLRVPVVVAAPVTTIVLYVWNYATAHWAIRGRRY